MRIIKFIFPIICSLVTAQELKINNDYLFTSKDSILVEKSYDFLDSYFWTETEWEPVNIDNKLNVTLVNNQNKSLLFYLNPVNIDAEFEDSMFIYGNDVSKFEISIFNKQNEKVMSEFLAYNAMDRIDYYGNPLEKNSFLNKGIWKSTDNKYEDSEPYLYILNPGEKVLLFIDLRLPADNILTRPYTYDFQNQILASLKITFVQIADELKKRLNKKALRKLEKEKVEIFDGVLESNNVKIIELRRR